MRPLHSPLPKPPSVARQICFYNSKLGRRQLLFSLYSTIFSVSFARSPDILPAEDRTMATITNSESIAVEPYLEASNYGEEPDSAYGAEVGSYTTSLASSITDYKVENNRRYHAYKEGSYVYPNDDKENDRLDIMHKLTEVSLGGTLNLAPVPAKPQRILDIGTGTGIWAIEMGDRYPDAEILGNDLSPIQPRW